MPTTIAFVNGKGGVGKTTCATLIAAALKEAGQTVSIDDRDPQCSATTAAEVFGLSVGVGEAIVIIDTAPSIESPATLAAIRSADLVILVTTPSPLDLATTAATAGRIKAEREGATMLLFNMVQTNNRFFEEMPTIAKEIPFPAFKNFIGRRTAYQTAQLQGWRSIPAALREDVVRVTTELALALSKTDRQTIRH
jgi:chromosome partitioning protein